MKDQRLEINRPCVESIFQQVGPQGICNNIQNTKKISQGCISDAPCGKLEDKGLQIPTLA